MSLLSCVVFLSPVSPDKVVVDATQNIMRRERGERIKCWKRDFCLSTCLLVQVLFQVLNHAMYQVDRMIILKKSTHVLANSLCKT